MKLINELSGYTKIPGFEKLLRIMKLTCLLIFIAVYSVLASDSYSQSKTLTINIEEASVKDVLSKIEEQSDFYFMYSRKVVDVDREVSVNFNKKKIDEVLNSLFEGTNVNYTIKGRIIVLSNPEFFEMESQTISRQNRISGTVTDDKGLPIPGATIVVKGSTIGTVTNIDGKYSLSGISDKATLVFSFVGMKTQEVTIENKSIINVTLNQDYIGLDEVVAIGYGTMKKRDLTGAISSVNVSEVAQSRPTNNVADALQGKAAGVRITQRNGDVNQSTNIQIRGINSITSAQKPLIVINGVPSSSTNLNEFESSDIQSLEILKDASAAAIYGSRGAAGVILITTKKGEAGKSTLDFNYTYSVQTPNFEQLPQMANAQEYITMFKEAQNNGWVYYKGGNRNDSPALASRGNNVNYSYPVEWNDPNVVANWPSTNWLRHYYQPAPVHTANLAASGGNEKGNYRISTNYTDFTGMLANTYKRLSVNTLVEANITRWAKFGTVMDFRYQKEPSKLDWTIEIAYQNLPIFMPAAAGERYGHPTVSKFTGVNLEPYRSLLFQADGQMWLESTRMMNQQSEDLKVFVNPYLELYPVKGLSFLTNFNYDFSRGDNSTYTPIDYGNLAFPNATPSFNRGFAKGDHWYYENRLNFKKEWGNHRIDLTASFNAEKTEYLGVSMTRRYYEDDKIQYLNAGKEISGASESAVWANTMASYLGRAFYSYKDKYLATATLRRDGSSRFGTNYKWGSFPSGALVWRMSEEGFMQPVKSYVDNLKLRATYGFSGNNTIGNYAWMASVNKGFAPLGGTKQVTAQKGELPKDDLRWEKTGALDLGFDASLFKGKLNLVFDYYNSKTEDLLLNLPISSVTGYTSLLQNIGSVRNWGMEFTANTVNLDKAVKWTTDFNIYFNRSEVLDMGGAPWQDIGTANGLPIRAFVGQPLRQFYTLDYLGTYKDQNEIANLPNYAGATPGDAKYVDHNGDKKIDGNDAVVKGNPEPDFSGGMTNTFKYKGLELSFLMTYSVGAEKVNLMIRRTYWNQGYRNFSKDYYQNHWSESNPDGYYTKIVSAVNVHSMNKIASSVWLEDASFLKLKDVTFAYNLPASLTNKIGVQKARIFSNANNLLTWTNYTGGDPEQGGGTSEGNYNDNYSFFEYAIPRIWTFGVNITF